MPKKANKSPNFVDLRRRHSRQGQLIQDVIPQAKHRWVIFSRGIGATLSSWPRHYILGIFIFSGLTVWMVIAATGTSKPDFSGAGHLGFDLYYPAALPAHSAIDANSFIYNQGIAQFKVSVDNKTVVFTEQKLPYGLPGSLLRGQSSIHSNLGQVQIKSASSMLIGSLQTPTTLIIGNSLQPIARADFQQLFKHLNRY